MGFRKAQMIYRSVLFVGFLVGNVCLRIETHIVNCLCGLLQNMLSQYIYFRIFSQCRKIQPCADVPLSIIAGILLCFVSCVPLTAAKQHHQQQQAQTVVHRQQACQQS